MARTTLTIDDGLLRDLKERAARQGTTLGKLLEDLVRLALRQPKPGPFRVRLPTLPGKTLPGVTIEDRDSLFDLMDGR